MILSDSANNEWNEYLNKIIEVYLAHTNNNYMPKQNKNHKNDMYGNFI